MPLQRRRRRSQSREYSDDYKRMRLAAPSFYEYSHDEYPAAVSDMRYLFIQASMALGNLFCFLCWSLICTVLCLLISIFVLKMVLWISYTFWLP